MPPTPTHSTVTTHNIAPQPHNPDDPSSPDNDGLDSLPTTDLRDFLSSRSADLQQSSQQRGTPETDEQYEASRLRYLAVRNILQSRSRTMPRKDRRTLRDEIDQADADAGYEDEKKSWRNRLLGGAAVAGAGTRLRDVPLRATSRVHARMMRGTPNERRKRFLGTALTVGLLGIVIWKAGEASIMDFGDGKDLGIDLLPGPFGGDGKQGDGSGLDLNIFNKTNALNDDPTQVVTSQGGFDVAPPYFDGDGINLWPWSKQTIPTTHALPTPTAIPSETLVPTPTPSSTASHEVIGGKHPLTPVSPHPPVDGSHNGLQHTVAGHGSHSTATHHAASQHLDNFRVEKGHGYIQEVREMGQHATGGHYTDNMALDAFSKAQNKFGNNLISLPGHQGPDTYMVGNDPRISAPGAAHWRNIEIQQFFHEEFMRQIDLADKAKKLQGVS